MIVIISSSMIIVISKEKGREVNKGVCEDFKSKSRKKTEQGDYI